MGTTIKDTNFLQMLQKMNQTYRRVSMKKDNVLSHHGEQDRSVSIERFVFCMSDQKFDSSRHRTTFQGACARARSNDRLA